MRVPLGWVLGGNLFAQLWTCRAVLDISLGAHLDLVFLLLVFLLACKYLGIRLRMDIGLNVCFDCDVV